MSGRSAPLLADAGIVTFHDVRLPGVAEALSELRRLDAELEILTFPEIGAGTGVLRRRVPVTLPRRAQTGSGFVDASRKTTLAPESVAPAVAGSQERSRFERWSYLKTPAYQTRYNLAAAFVDQSNYAVVEIGRFPNSIVFWLEKSRTAHLVEPYAPNSFVKDVEKAAQTTGRRGLRASSSRRVGGAPTTDATALQSRCSGARPVCRGAR